MADGGLDKAVTWKPFRSGANPSIYADHDVLLHSCRQEAFGRVAIEAVQQGLLVVGPQEGGMAEVLGRDEVGLRVDFLAGAAAVDKVWALWSDEQRFSAFCSRAWRMARGRFGASSPATAMARLYANIAAVRVTES